MVVFIPTSWRKMLVLSVQSSALFFWMILSECHSVVHWKQSRDLLRFYTYGGLWVAWEFIRPILLIDVSEKLGCSVYSELCCWCLSLSCSIPFLTSLCVTVHWICLISQFMCCAVADLRVKVIPFELNLRVWHLWPFRTDSQRESCLNVFTGLCWTFIPR